MPGQADTRVVNIKKEKTGFMVLTTSNYCETIGGVHEDVNMTYIIKKNHISQKCPACKKNTSRTHILTPDVLKVLKQ